MKLLINSIRVRPDLDRKFWAKALAYQFAYSIIRLVLGLASIVCGVVLVLHGITGSTKSWTASIFGFRSSMTDAPAGSVLFAVGAVVIYITRFIVELQGEKKGKMAQAKKKKKSLPD